MLVRRFREEDLKAVFAIYDDEVLHGTATFDTEVYDSEARARWAERHTSARYPALVAESAEGVVVGWASLSPYSDRSAYARTSESSVYVHRDHQGRGIGRALLVSLIATAKEVGLSVLLARITSESAVSVALHEALGFQRIGTMRRVGEKFGRVLDVALLDLHLD
jgi:L-amino acid N-acyltransferase YncA